VAASFDVPRKSLIQWLEKEGLWSSVSPWESDYLQAKRPRKKDNIEANQSAEAAATLAWSLGLIPELPHASSPTDLELIVKVITDFGLARSIDDVMLTKSGTLAGTPQYMSPEQARGERIDERSDLFSLGSLLYFLCTGQSPFRSETVYGVLHKITSAALPDMREVQSSVPEWLQHLVSRLHAPSPEDRFQSSAVVADLLEQCLPNEESRLDSSMVISVGLTYVKALIEHGWDLNSKAYKGRTPLLHAENRKHRSIIFYLKPKQ
jgi:serine/threonine protein kinase